MREKRYSSMPRGKKNLFSINELTTIFQFSFIFESRTTLWINEVFNHGEYRGVLGRGEKEEKRKNSFLKWEERSKTYSSMYEKRERGREEEEYKVAKLPKLRAFLVPPFSDAGVISKNIRSWVRLRRVFSIYLFLSFSSFQPSSSFGLHSNILSVLPIRTFVSRTRSSLEKRSCRKRQNKLASSGDVASVDLISILEWGRVLRSRVNYRQFRHFAAL